MASGSALLEKKEKRKGALVAYTQQIHLRVKRHYLHILLHHIPGARSFEDLKMSPDGMLLSTFKETAIAYGST